MYLKDSSGDLQFERRHDKGSVPRQMLSDNVIRILRCKCVTFDRSHLIAACGDSLSVYTLLDNMTTSHRPHLLMTGTHCSIPSSELPFWEAETFGWTLTMSRNNVQCMLSEVIRHRVQRASVNVRMFSEEVLGNPVVESGDSIP